MKTMPVKSFTMSKVSVAAKSATKAAFFQISARVMLVGRFVFMPMIITKG